MLSGANKRLHITIIICSMMIAFGFARHNTYPWLDRNHETGNTIAGMIALPPGYERVNAAEDSFARWLRHLPVRPGALKVRLYNGQLKPNQSAHYAIIDIDVGEKDLQQCADALMRLRAEYLFSQNKHDAIHFNFTSGDRADWIKWRQGWRPEIDANRVQWRRQAAVDSSYKNFRRYLETVFIYAGTYSLKKELHKVAGPQDIRIGDVFIQGGFPGHAVLVVDMARHSVTGEKIFLLAQSYTPAQDIHILKNPLNSALSPWYKVKDGGRLQTPEWEFDWGDLRRF